MVADEDSKVRHQLEVAGKQLMNMFGQPGEDGADGTVVFLDISGLLPSFLQGQSQYGQIVVSSFKPDADGALGIEPFRHAADECIRIRSTIASVGGLP